MFEELKNLKGSFVYVIEDEYGLIKIGISKNPYCRFKTILNLGGCNFKNYYVSEDTQYSSKIEKDMHSIYNDYRINGEWFKGCFYLDVVNKLKTIVSDYKNINIDNKNHKENNSDIVFNLALQSMKFGVDNILCYDFSKGKILPSDLQQIQQIAIGFNIFNDNNDIVNKVLKLNSINESNVKDIQMFLLNVVKYIGYDNFCNNIEKNIVDFYFRVLGLFKLNQLSDDIIKCSLVFNLLLRDWWR